MQNLQWVNGTLREPFMGMDKNTKIVFAESPLRYTAVGKSYLLYNGEHIWSVAESFGGPHMMNLIYPGKPHSKNEVLLRKTAKTVSNMRNYLRVSQKTLNTG